MSKKNCWGSYDYLFNQTELGVIFLHLNRLRDLKIKILKNGFPSHEGKFGYFQSEGYQTLKYLPRVSSVDLLLFLITRMCTEEFLWTAKDGTWSVL